MSKSNCRAVVTTLALLPALFLAVASPSAALAQAPSATASPQGTTPAPTAAAKVKQSSIDRVEARITDLHKKLLVTADQESLWRDMAQVMRENEKKMRDGIAARSAKMKTMNAVDDLRSYQMITDEHADGLKRLIPSFEALYGKMTPTQQKNADRIFGEQQRHAQRTS
jgi:hypothetical protein